MTNGLTLPMTTHTRPFSDDPERHLPHRLTAWEVYTRFGRRLGLWRHDRCGTLAPPEVTRFVVSNGPECWCRLVTYAEATT